MHILVISDVHGNLTALDAVIKDAGRFDQVWCLGDVVGYGPEPNECIKRLREFDATCLAGNHDLAVAGKTPLWEFTQDALDVIFWTRHWLTPSSLDFLNALPVTPLVMEQGITLVHASLRDPVWEYINEKSIAKANLELLTTPISLNGHTHIPVIYRKPWDDWRILEEWPRVNSSIKLALDQMFINPGSVGQPRDEDPRAAYAILDTETMTFTYRRTQYDVAIVQTLMKQAKFPSRLVRRLRLGQ
jgi:predicted phosphodiesterase